MRKTQTVAQWSEELEINYHTLWNRLRIGWSVEKTLTSQVLKYQINIYKLKMWTTQTNSLNSAIDK